MGRFAVLFSYVMLIGCLRPVWSAPLITTPVVASVDSRNGIPSEPPEPVDDGVDYYRIALDHMTLTPWRFTFYVSSTESYPFRCRWQSTICTGSLPTEARATRIVRIGLPHRLCDRIRIFREDEELEVSDRFRWGCGFILDDPTETPP